MEKCFVVYNKRKGFSCISRDKSQKWWGNDYNVFSIQIDPKDINEISELFRRLSDLKKAASRLDNAEREYCLANLEDMVKSSELDFSPSTYFNPTKEKTNER
jgi:hypothetical protein